MPLGRSVVSLIAISQPGGHHHELNIPVHIGPLALRILLLLAIPAVAGFALLRPFLPRPDRTAEMLVCVGGATAVLLELMLAKGIDIPAQTVPLLLISLAGSLFAAMSRDPRRAGAVHRADQVAPWMLVLIGSLAFAVYASVWLGSTPTAEQYGRLHTGIMLGVTGLAWLPRCRLRTRLGTALIQGGAAVLATGVVASLARVMILVPSFAGAAGG
jgi:uncharacterized protein DUF6239